jgi:hypothetical protein
MPEETSGGDIFPTVVLPKDVEAVQTAIKADYTQIREALIRCALADKFSPSKTPSEWDAWQSMKDRTEAYIAESPSFLDSKAQLARGEALQKELATWHDKTKALGCDIADAAPSSPIPGGADEASIFNFGTGFGAGALLLVLFLLWKGKL